MIDLTPACDQMIVVLDRVADAQLDAATPCTEFTVGDLIDHVDLVCRGATALAAGDTEELARTAEGPDSVHLRPDWRTTVVRHVRALGEAWDDPAVWQAGIGVPGSDFTNEMWGKIALTELVVHGWDIASATGQRLELPEATLQACFDHVVVFVPGAPVPDLWGDAVRVATDAPLLDRIVAITGRTP